VLDKNLFGQHIVRDSVVASLHMHFVEKNPRKPLVLIFHGTDETGKTYVTELIAQSIYKYGLNSEYVQKFIGRKDFPEESQAKQYEVSGGRGVF
jgi:torsin-1